MIATPDRTATIPQAVPPVKGRRRVSVKEEDRPSFDEMIRGTGYAVWHTALQRAGGNEADAEEILQAAKISAHSGWKTFRPLWTPRTKSEWHKAFNSWFKRIIENRATDKIRSQARRNQHEISLDVVMESPDGEPHSLADIVASQDRHSDPFRAVLWRDTMESVSEILMRIPQPYARSVYLVNVQGRSYAEVAKIMRCPIGTVKSRVLRGKQMLREIINAEGIQRPD